MSVQSAPIPGPTPMHARWEQALAEHQLQGTRCTHCGTVHAPPRALCPHCHSEALEVVVLSGRATLAGFTSISVGPSVMIAQGYDRHNPYISGLVQLEEGPHLSARILGLDAKRPTLDWIGIPLAATFVDATESSGVRTTLAFTAAA